MAAPLAVINSIITVSADSSILSSLTANEGRSTVVAPAAIVTVPDARVKSVPEPVAVPPTTEYCTEAALADGVVKLIVITGAAVASELLEFEAANWMVLVSLSLIV